MIEGGARVEITQLALVVNVGLALALSGRNDATSTGGKSATAITTGDATAIGLQGNTTITQVVSLLDADQSTSQTANVVNVGVSISNSGGNLAIAQQGPDGHGTAVAVQWGPASASQVSTGGSSAVGNAAHTTIVQVAVGVAKGDGVLRISQRAIVVNLGAGVAVSGENEVGDAERAALVNAVVAGVLGALLDADWSAATGAPAVHAGSGSGSVPGGQISTGDAVAVGNSMTTSITQQASGTVDGHDASADQEAIVTNIGAALANTGGNGVAATGASAATVGSIVQALISLVTSGSDETWSNDFELSDLLVDALAAASTRATELTSPSGGSVSITQITAVLNLAFAIANSGENVASTSSSGDVVGGGPHLPGTAEEMQAPWRDTLFARALTSVLGISTGDATSANTSDVSVCQVINVSPTVCEPPAPEPEPEPPVVVPVSEIAPAATTQQLAFTGSGSVTETLLVGFGLAALGLVLTVATRRRNVGVLDPTEVPRP
jgi:hypothetical protein